LLRPLQKKDIVLVRPITYIRDVMGHSTWNELFATPEHREFPAAYAANGGVVAAMLWCNTLPGFL
jgi:hypothetical protein